MLDVMEMILIMPDFIIAFLIVASVGGLGLMLILFSVSEWIYYAKIPKCIEITEGKIIKHRCLGEGEIRPIGQLLPTVSGAYIAEPTNGSACKLIQIQQARLSSRRMIGGGPPVRGQLSW